MIKIIAVIGTCSFLSFKVIYHQQ